LRPPDLTAPQDDGMNIEQLKQNFELLGDWDARYGYVIDIGAKLPPLAQEHKTDANLVQGCMSNVWVTGALSAHDGRTLGLVADSDAPIVKGLIAILLLAYAGKTPAQALEVDADEIFNDLGLFDHLSPTRHVGVYAMVEKIRGIARACLAAA
jgi:cysteine desulfuration protein SufE